MLQFYEDLSKSCSQSLLTATCRQYEHASLNSFCAQMRIGGATAHTLYISHVRTSLFFSLLLRGENSSRGNDVLADGAQTAVTKAFTEQQSAELSWRKAGSLKFTYYLDTIRYIENKTTCKLKRPFLSSRFIVSKELHQKLDCHFHRLQICISCLLGGSTVEFGVLARTMNRQN